MKIWSVLYDLARLTESYGVAILAGGIMIAFTRPELKTVSQGFMISGIIIILVSVLYRNKGDKVKESIEDISRKHDEEKKKK